MEIKLHETCTQNYVTRTSRVATIENLTYIEGMKNYSLSKPQTLLIVLTAASLLSACTINNNPAPSNSQSATSMTNNGMMGNQSSLSAADIMFLQMMIPHHEQAIEMSKLAATNTKNSGVLDLAARIEAAQQPEIELMKKLLSDSGQPLMSDHGMGDNGMMKDGDMVALAAAKDSEFDVLYLTGMMAHHEGAITMANGVSDSSNNDVNTLANNIISSQTAEITEMPKLLAAAS